MKNKTLNNAVTPRQSQFIPKMKANAIPHLLSSLVWIDHYNECNGMTSLMELMLYETCNNLLRCIQQLTLKSDACGGLFQLSSRHQKSFYFHCEVWIIHNRCGKLKNAMNGGYYEKMRQFKFKWQWFSAYYFWVSIRPQGLTIFKHV